MPIHGPGLLRHAARACAQVRADAAETVGHVACTPCPSFFWQGVRAIAMMIGRCAWHRHYHGYPLLNGITSWRGFGVRFTDGICPRCLAQFRAEHRRLLERLPERAIAVARQA